MIDINLWKNLNKVEFKENFYLLCLSDTNCLLIKKLFLSLDIKNKFNSDVLGCGLMASVTYSQEKVFNLVFDIAKKLSIELTIEDIEPAFNLACQKNNINLMDLIDEKTSVIEKSLATSGFSPLSEDGTIYHTGCACDGESSHYDSREIGTNLMSNYRGNIFEFICNHEKEESLNFLLSRNYKIDPTLVESEFLNACKPSNHSSPKIKTIVMLLLNEKTKKIIEQSNSIQLYFQEPTQDVELKKEIKSIISGINLKNKLDTDLTSKTILTINKKI